ncbi:MAG: HEAT repeat domain-containing protein [Bradymonadaceae bacterium]|nr:HEAT repeat domain-containing protein [Lujinxingiaceae bacterium]
MSIRLKPLIALITMALLVPTAADAQLSKEGREEVRGYAEELKDNADPQAQQAAIMTLGRLADRAQRKQLEAFKQAEHERVRLAAGMALLLSGDRTANAFLVVELSKSTSLFKTLREVTSALPDDIESQLIVELLKKATPEIQRDVYRYLALQHGALYELLGGQLADRDAATRTLALEATMFTLRPDSLVLARALLANRDDDVRQIGVRLAAGLKANPLAVADVTALLESALKDRTPRIAESAARELTTLRNQAGVDALVGLLPKAEAASRQELVALLLEHDVRPPLAPIKPLLKSAEQAEDRALLYELAAASREPEIFEELQKMFASDKFDDRLIAARALGRTKNALALDILARGLFEGRPEIRVLCARSLGLLQNEAALPHLRRAINAERVKEIKLETIAAVGQIKTVESIQILRFLITDNDLEVKRQVVKSLRALGLPEGAAALEILFRDRNLDIQWLAFLTALELNPAMGLRQAQISMRSPPEGFLTDLKFHRYDAATREALLEQLITHSDARVRTAIAARLITLSASGLAVARKSAARTSTPPDLRRELVLSLAERRDAADLALFEAIVREPDAGEVAQIAAWALSHSGSSELEASYRGYLGNKSQIIRSIAVYGMSATETKR